MLSMLNPGPGLVEEGVWVNEKDVATNKDMRIRQNARISILLKLQ
jgi:hypothetical protein